MDIDPKLYRSESETREPEESELWLENLTSNATVQISPLNTNYARSTASIFIKTRAGGFLAGLTCVKHSPASILASANDHQMTFAFSRGGPTFKTIDPKYIDNRSAYAFQKDIQVVIKFYSEFLQISTASEFVEAIYPSVCDIFPTLKSAAEHIASVRKPSLHKFAIFYDENYLSGVRFHFSNHIGTSFFHELVDSFISDLLRHDDVDHARNPRLRASIVKICCEYMESIPHRRLNLSELSNCTGYTASQIRDAFLDLMGCSPQYWHSARRMRIAYSLLAKPQSTQKVSDIAVSMGFNHLGRFAINFKSLFGVSPHEVLENAA